MPTISSSRRRQLAGQKAALSRSRPPTDPDYLAVSCHLDFEGLREHAAKVIEAWPDPPPDILADVAAILRCGGSDPPTPTSAPDPAFPQQAATPSPEANYSGCPTLRENSKLRGDSA
ncbi:hypothetical protein NJB1507_45240 [Mycobacterium marinum]|uniref:hypothetical protein n=1 Tax=Mycobacterium marinum TaxID=1781 RepID=UPI0021C33C5B|nr:hypothetical protein [Mycobacterium marinum]GJO33426.1 hypothetical protein NJB1507_45240 [Mycobacterium marinum]